MWSLRRVAPVMAALLLLSACETVMSQAPGPSPSPAPPPPRPSPPSAAPPQAAATPAPAEIPRIEGMRREDIIARLGPPAAERDAAPAKVLDYKATGCEVAVYLYFDTGRGGFFALHYDVNGRQAPTRDTDRCLRAIAQGAKRG